MQLLAGDYYKTNWENRSINEEIIDSCSKNQSDKN